MPDSVFLVQDFPSIGFIARGSTIHCETRADKPETSPIFLEKSTFSLWLCLLN
jgi:hypothetical protein